MSFTEANKLFPFVKVMETYEALNWVSALLNLSKELTVKYYRFFFVFFSEIRLNKNGKTLDCYSQAILTNCSFMVKGESAVGPTHISDSLLRRCLSAVSVRSFQ